jgi:hypothetical protein
VRVGGKAAWKLIGPPGIIFFQISSFSYFFLVGLIAPNRGHEVWGHPVSDRVTRELNPRNNMVPFTGEFFDGADI